jgi:protein-glutamine gamma-glutamyltransferase
MEQYRPGSVERSILGILSESEDRHSYSSPEQLSFELSLRREIIDAANAQMRSGLRFKIFRESFCNPDFWERTPNGGFALKSGVKPSDAIRDIFKNGRLYGTECATAMVMIYYKALLELFPEEDFNRIFPSPYLMNWHNIERELQSVGAMMKSDTFLPGDRRYFANPDVDPVTPEWQGENVIDMDNGYFYGHGVGKYRADVFIEALNRKRKEDADESAYLMEAVGRPNFKRLFNLYERATAQN